MGQRCEGWTKTRRHTLSPTSHPPHSQAQQTRCDDACQRHVKLTEGAILAATLGGALAWGVFFMRSIDVPTRFLGGVRGGGGE